MELRQRVNFADYLAAAVEHRGMFEGAAFEYNRELGIPTNKFDLSMLAPSPKLETRAAIDGDTAASEQPWLDRLFAGSRANYIGVTFRSVESGIAAYPAYHGGR